MSVVVTPDARSPVLDTFDVKAVVQTAEGSVAEWRDAGADVLVVDSLDADLVREIRASTHGEFVPVVQVTPSGSPDSPADAFLETDADAAAATDALSRAVRVRDYRAALADLYDACMTREPGQPDDTEIRELRALADRSFQALDEIPPSVFYP